MGVFNFWNQSCRLPKERLKAVQTLAYNYILAGKRNVAWKVMTLPKYEGVLGLRDFRKLALAASMKWTWHYGHVKGSYRHNG